MMDEDKAFAGIDVGTTTTKAVIVDADSQMIGHFVQRSGTDLAGAAATAFERALTQTSIGRDGIRAIVATGYGRKSVSFAHQTKTEISCHGRGCYHHFPKAITVVDIGGQDNKIIRLDAQGRRVGFKMNRKCAAGTGAFLEEMAYKLGIPIDQLNSLAEAASEIAPIGSYCTVFTATEVLDRIRVGENTGNIVRGLYESIVKRILEMDRLSDQVILTGGVVAFNPIVAELLRARVDVEVVIAPHPQEIGAFGAALFAMEAS